ncbi:hypothetical protein GDO81_001283 [Engystomops pustulosus]|uniref:Uncharacterized protein n=1 Tax=Engystomops pustulosus TaxID=76066 RepID=A0AAV7DDH6_ENGPU|nr:hypothetical protein GDO81_001283 [Engystomops pustulosus]
MGLLSIQMVKVHQFESPGTFLEASIICMRNRHPMILYYSALNMAGHKELIQLPENCPFYRSIVIFCSTRKVLSFCM